jgi:LmbE family N-acetylglucosaminyl deacetylase
MDDGVLACGGTIAGLSQKDHVHVAYATDGGQSPRPVHSWMMGSTALDLIGIRKQEARVALRTLGLPIGNVHFLGLPDGSLKYHTKALSQSLVELIARLRPDRIFVPFRFDRHPDHLALNRTVVQMYQSVTTEAELFEYFVYYRWRLLPGRDVRQFIRPDQLVQVDISAFSARKKQALKCFISQTTRVFSWQERPILTGERVNQVSQSPEVFLRYEADLPGATIFAAYGPWIRFVHLLEPMLKQKKEQIRALVHAGVRRNGR